MTRPMIRRSLARAALVAGLLAAIAGSPIRGSVGSVDIARLAAAVAHEEDHVTAAELAVWMREGKRGLRVIDVRSAPAFDAYHLPGAELIPIEAIPAARFDAGDTIVLYSDGGAHAAQAWVFLRALGHAQVYFLRGGLEEWLEAGAPGVERPAVQSRRGGC